MIIKECGESLKAIKIVRDSMPCVMSVHQRRDAFIISVSFHFISSDLWPFTS